MSKYKVLIVDDEEMIVKSCMRVLRQAGFDVLGTTDPNEALKIVTSEEVSVVISDQRMPVMLGAELLSKIKEVSPDTTRVILTGYADINAAMSAINDGNVFQYLSKPWEDKEFKINIEKAAELYTQNVEANSNNKENRKKNIFLELKNAELEEKVRAHSSEIAELNDKLMYLEECFQK